MITARVGELRLSPRTPLRPPEPCSTPLQSVAASCCPLAPSSHCRSRKVDHIDTQAISFSWANIRTCAASARAKVSPATSSTPLIEVSAMPRQAPASDSPNTFFNWACADSAELTASSPMSPVYDSP